MRGSAGLAHRFHGALLIFGCALLGACGGAASPQTSGGGGSRTGTGGAATGAGGAVVTGTGGVRGSGGATGSGVGGKSGVGGSSAAGSGGASGGGTGGSSGGTPSHGCGATSWSPSGHYTIDVSGQSREYIIKLPDGYDPRHPYRLIFAFHGRMYDAQSVADGGPPGSGPYYGIEALAGGSTIFVAPQALDTSWTNQNGRDVAYVNAMLARFESELCIDTERVFSTGFSMGAIMTIALGCAEADVFRAIAAMSGEIMGTCSGNTPLAYWSSHGMSDPTIPIAMGVAARDEFRRRDHCSADSTPGSPAGCIDFSGCDAAHPVTWCPFDGVHEPPPFAGQAIWAFFSRF